MLGMNILGDIKAYGRFVLGLRRFLRQPILSLEEARMIIKNRMEKREGNFLRLVERGIFGYARSPYLPLLKMAGCEMGDVRNMVKTKGLEDTLRALKEAGVYVSFEEFKGREPMERYGQVIPVRPHDFDNPYLSQYYQATTGGSTGAATRVRIDLDHLADTAPHLMLTREAHGILNVPTAIWYGVFPDHAGFAVILRQARFGRLAVGPRHQVVPNALLDGADLHRGRSYQRSPLIQHDHRRWHWAPALRLF